MSQQEQAKTFGLGSHSLLIESQRHYFGEHRHGWKSQWAQETTQNKTKTKTTTTTTKSNLEIPYLLYQRMTRWNFFSLPIDQALWTKARYKT